MQERLRGLKGVIFGWDGTLVDSARAMLLSYRYAYQKHLGIFFPRNEAEFIEMVPMRLAESSAKFGGQHAADVANSYNRYYEEEACKTARAFPGVPETLIALRSRGYMLGVASNKSRGRIDKDIEYTGLEGLIDIYVTSEDTVKRKPDPDPLLKVAEKLEMPPGAFAYVGDYKGDIVAARAAGMLSVAVKWGGMFPIETLLAEHPDFVVDKPEELLGIFRGVRTPEQPALT